MTMQMKLMMPEKATLNNIEVQRHWAVSTESSRI